MDDGKMVNVSLVRWMIMDFPVIMWLVTPFISHKKAIWKENKRTYLRDLWNDHPTSQLEIIEPLLDSADLSL